jgi:hypothetical protein
MSTSMVLLTLDPSPADIRTHLDPLSQRLSNLEHSLRTRNQWHTPPSPPKSPEYSIIDIADLSSAITLLENLHTTALCKPRLPYSFFSEQKWMWDPMWKEFYSRDESQAAYTYLSTWRLNEARQVWEHVSMNGTANLLPDRAVDVLGSWEDWEWDEGVGEWCLDVSDAGNCRCYVFASRWEMRGGGDWVYVGSTG